MTKQTYTGEEVRVMLKEAGILHYQAAERLGISQNYFSVRLKGEFTDLECHQMGILPTLKFSGYDFEEDLKTIIQYYWPELMDTIVQLDEFHVVDDIITTVKRNHCRTIEVWDYKGE